MMNEYPASAGWSEGATAENAPGRSHGFEGNDGHTSSNSGKKGTHAVSLAVLA